MPLGTLQHPERTGLAARPPRLRPVGPAGGAAGGAAGRPKQSAVERLEADKAKYVKSQVALSKRQPVRPPDAGRSLLNPDAALRPTRKAAPPTKTQKGGVQLNLEHLTNLISDVNDGPRPGSAADSVDGEAPDCPAPPQKKERPRPPPRPGWSAPARVRLKVSEPAEVRSSSASCPPTAGTVRRVDVMPQAGPARTSRVDVVPRAGPAHTSCRPPRYIRKPLQPVPLHFQFPLRAPLKPAAGPLKPDNPRPPSAGSPVPPSPSPNILALPPPSPAITRLSSSSSRKRPSLTRSKSDVSDQRSRAGTDLERFFNLCGLDPADLPELTGSGSDMVSMARFHSASAPGSECAASGAEDDGAEEEEEEEAAGNANGRAPYGVSVIERNARVIKWLYGLRREKDNASKSTAL
ncbi:protein FAM110A [Brachionichthys hirsutus]|uniref:protein FAM110A n=1 Tax=Brachionichthys hirsutus TaxID=412623 RepID=UPI0036045D98